MSARLPPPDSVKNDSLNSSATDPQELLSRELAVAARGRPAASAPNAAGRPPPPHCQGRGAPAADAGSGFRSARPTGGSFWHRRRLGLGGEGGGSRRARAPPRAEPTHKNAPRSLPRARAAARAHTRAHAHARRQRALQRGPPPRARALAPVRRPPPPAAAALALPRAHTARVDAPAAQGARGSPRPPRSPHPERRAGGGEQRGGGRRRPRCRRLHKAPLEKEAASTWRPPARAARPSR